ncbi:MAG: nucleoside monophosphate kinase [Sphaerospermopsis sp. SIO1G2]|nr:nucleoside monophosphate kinase [Sphaerospermopsis sp. SIO1G1]NET69538.1 nucleoside monophosphate kinase [Sphaerospermopsis sp. SIO1G2]
MKLVILGGSGSGKSTQAQMLCKHFHIPIISTGEILRAAINNSKSNTDDKRLNDLGKNAQNYVLRGELVPDEMMIEFIKLRLSESDASEGWILEGYPRTAFQAEELDFLLESWQEKLDWAIYLQVPEAVMVSRSLGRSLPDDQPEIVQRRVELFYDRTVPILEYYDRRRRLLTINGDNSPEQVKYNILDLLD